MATSSADPQQLSSYLAASADMADLAKARASALVAEYEEVVPRLQWGTFNASATLDDLATWLRANDADDQWLADVAAAFRTADGGPVDDQLLSRQTRVAGDLAGRADLDVHAPLAFLDTATPSSDGTPARSDHQGWHGSVLAGRVEHLAGDAAHAVAVPVTWTGDHLDEVAAAAVVVGGAAMIATGVGAPIGAGLLIGAGLSAGGQLAFTGHVEAREIWVDAAAGGATAGVGSLAVSATTRLGLTGARALAATTTADAAGSAATSSAQQYLTTGRVQSVGVGLGLDALLAAVPEGPALRSAGRSARFVDDVPAESPLAGILLRRELASRQQMAEGGRTLMGAGTDKALGDAPRLAAYYGGHPEDWAKMTSTPYEAGDDTQFETHWFKNVITHELVEHKTKFTKGRG